VTRNAKQRSGLGPRALRAAADNGEFFPEFSALSISDEQQVEKPNLWVRLFCSATERAEHESTKIGASLEALMKSCSRLAFLLLPASLAFGPACSCAGDSADGSGAASTESGPGTS
jgi:hypothetical protein